MRSCRSRRPLARAHLRGAICRFTSSRIGGDLAAASASGSCTHALSNVSTAYGGANRLSPSERLAEAGSFISSKDWQAAVLPLPVTSSDPVDCTVGTDARAARRMSAVFRLTGDDRPQPGFAEPGSAEPPETLGGSQRARSGGACGVSGGQLAEAPRRLSAVFT